MGVKVGTSGSE